ncbi:sulfite exporter TauE/SafE family protein [Mesorhizobium sp. BH1-1-4]|uniref:sulfite exporter TauE/SafE family protein n=1 Tax=Mesorhizobium sp. BH1-1-4 TaxID=2876662 RepID=UPI001CD0AEEF|nr:sulfite exporter TauE/SafE family protein [Mesorhizobium sp. BH1-1-4]MBZ9995737.1 sulfite exporter TauE/SafE family protein [Mesorhizobium sp. BH1-1-4]
MLSIGAVAFVGFVFLAAGLVKGVVGMGLPTVAMGLLAVTMPPAQAAALLLIPSLVTNLWQLFTGPSFGGLSKRLWTMMAGVVIGTVAGAGLLTGAHTTIASAGLGTALVLYALVGLARAGFTTPARHEAWMSPLVGVATGLVTGATGVFVIPAVPYLQSLRLGREELIQALGLSFTVSTSALGFGLFRTGALASPTAQLAGSVLALLPALAGMFVGQALRQRMSVETFRTVFFAGLLALGAYLMLEAAL